MKLLLFGLLWANMLVEKHSHGMGLVVPVDVVNEDHQSVKLC